MVPDAPRLVLFILVAGDGLALLASVDQAFAAVRELLKDRLALRLQSCVARGRDRVIRGCHHLSDDVGNGVDLLGDGREAGLGADRRNKGLDILDQESGLIFKVDLIITVNIETKFVAERYLP